MAVVGNSMMVVVVRLLLLLLVVVSGRGPNAVVARFGCRRSSLECGSGSSGSSSLELPAESSR